MGISTAKKEKVNLKKYKGKSLAELSRLQEAFRRYGALGEREMKAGLADRPFACGSSPSGVTTTSAFALSSFSRSHSWHNGPASEPRPF